MRVALVHDYLVNFGGAERVLMALSEIFPEAPIYTAFAINNSPATVKFEKKQIHESWAARIPGFKTKLHSPLRFLAPQIWEAFDFRGFDVVISSSSWYLTKGIKVPEKSLHISYIHTPPRYLYGYGTLTKFQQNWPVKVYAGIVNKFLRQYDYETAQQVDVLVANSKEVQSRIAKFWRRDSQVIYPPVELIKPTNNTSPTNEESKYYLTGGRLVGPKHFDVAIQAANRMKLKLKIFGSGPEEARLKAMAGPTVEFLGNVDELTLAKLYTNANAFLALADDEDFGITPVEAMMAGTPVVGVRGGGFQESIIEGETGIFIEGLTEEDILVGINKLQTQRDKFKAEVIKKAAEKFSKQRFTAEIKELVEREWEKKRAGIA